MSLQNKILGGFIAISLIAALVGGVGLVGSKKMEASIVRNSTLYTPSLRYISEIELLLHEISIEAKGLLDPSVPLESRRHSYEIIAGSYEEGQQCIQKFKGLCEKLEIDGLCQKTGALWNDQKALLDEYIAMNKAIDDLKIGNPFEVKALFEEKFGNFKQWTGQITRAVLEKKPLSQGSDLEDMPFYAFLNSLSIDNQDLQKARKEIIAELKAVAMAVGNISELLEIGEYELAVDVFLAEVLPSMENMQFSINDGMRPISEAFDKFKALQQYETKVTGKTLEEVEVFLASVSAAINKQVVVGAEDAYSLARSMAAYIIIALLAGITVAIVGGVFIARSISSPINRIIEQLNAGSEQVSSASIQVAASSQQISEGTSEQAASIEESSSSLEEMASMTRQNADNANQANSLMNDANQMASQANQSMEVLTASMEDISKASEDTQKIIKTIDEIAFQTNLLALNAAVEAARAGEAGAGFAVVADEVRNLAMRAAEAAKNTATLIEGTEKKIKDGAEYVRKTNDAFAQVSQSVSRVGELVGEISAASEEQSQGLQQTNRAIAEMDKVVQQNAANAEENASSSEELNSQAIQLKETTENLLNLINGISLNKLVEEQHAYVETDQYRESRKLIPK